MRRIRSFALCLTVLLLSSSGYCQSRGYYQNGEAGDEASAVSLIQLIANPSAYHGKVVQVIGYLDLRFEGNAIYLHQEDMSHGIAKNAVWINIPIKMTQDEIKAVNGHYAILSGRFNAHRQGHMGLFSGEFEDIYRLELWR